MKARSLAAWLLGGLVASAPALAKISSSPVGRPPMPGPMASGDILLPNGWSLHPAGKQVRLFDLPENLALHPSGRWLAVLHAGFSQHEVDIIELPALRLVTRLAMPQSFYGLAFADKGQRLLVSGGEDGTALVYEFAQGHLRAEAPLMLGFPNKVLVGGLAVAEAEKQLYAALTWGDAVVVRPLTPGGIPSTIALEKGSFPYALTLDAKRHRLYVSLWGRAAVSLIDTASGKITATWATASHPTEMALSPDGKTLYVACSNANRVDVLDTAAGHVREALSTGLYPNAPVGSTPDSLALTPDGKLLLVANAGANNVAVFRLGEQGSPATPLGFIPTGWYPTAVRFDAKSRRLFVANAKGSRSFPNPKGPTPMRQNDRAVNPQYIAELLRGSLSVIEFPSPSQLRQYSNQAVRFSPLKPDLAVVHSQSRSPIPAKVGDPSPIKHVVYIIKENRTYDQIFGDMREGNGDPSLCLFPEKATPNLHKLAREYVLLDNFYANAEVSAGGHEWSTAAYATDFVEKMWPLDYRGSDVVSYPAEGAFDAAARSSGGYLWDAAAAKHLSYINLGEWVNNGPNASAPGEPAVPALKDHIDPLYRGFDLRTTDQARANRFLVDLKAWEAKGVMPSLIVARLPNDHTAGTRRGAPTPGAYIADNDLAVGRIVEAISHSRFWPETAIFIVEDDAQNGPDHVDAHRTEALVISPYTKRHAVDSTMYSTTSMLRTMELILGLPPMSQFDAAARPMYESFQSKQDLTPFEHVAETVNLREVNTASSWGTKLSRTLVLDREDANDDHLMNELVWHAVKGAASPLPAAVHAAFIVPQVKEDED